MILWRTAGVSLASGWPLAAARSSATAAAALSHLLELLLLIGGQDLCQFGIDLFLQFLDLRFLIGGEIELILQGGRKYLAGFGGHASAAGATLVTAATAAGTAAAFAATATATTWAGVAFKACDCGAWAARRCGSVRLGNRSPGKRRNTVDRDGQERGQRFLHGGFLRLVEVLCVGSCASCCNPPHNFHFPPLTVAEP
jgi:hypothetical protein